MKNIETAQNIKGLEMKGFEEIINIVSVLIFIGGVIAISALIINHFLGLKGNVDTPIENLEAIHSAYAVENCFRGLDNNRITFEFLEKNNNDYISDICKIAYPPIEADIKDLEDGRSWDFPIPVLDELKQKFDWLRQRLDLWRDGKIHPEHSIWIPIFYDDFVPVNKEDEVVMKNGGDYVIHAYKNSDNLIVEIYPISDYEGGQADKEIEIDSGEKAKELKDYLMDEILGKGDLTGKNIKVNGSIDVKSEDLFSHGILGTGMGGLDLASHLNECEKPYYQKICIKVMNDEVHMGRLHVKV